MFHQGAATVKVTMESESEGEDSYGDEEEEVVVEVEQSPSSLHVQDRITSRQFDRVQVSHIRLKSFTKSNFLDFLKKN